MAGTALQGLLPVEVVAVFCSLVSVSFAFNNFRCNDGCAAIAATELLSGAVVLADRLGNDVLSTLDGISYGHVVAYGASDDLFHIAFTL